MPNTMTNESEKNLRLEQNSIGKNLENFIENLNSLMETFPFSMISIEVVRYTTEKIFSLHQEVLRKMEGVDLSTLNLNEEQLELLTEAFKRTQKASIAKKLVARSFIVSVVSQYDAFVGSIIKTLFVNKPDTLNVSEKQLTFSELMSFGSIEAATEHIIEKEIETVLRKSHSEQFDWLGNKFGVKLRENLHVWPDFIELTQRRNLFVHADGLVSQQYISVCEENNCYDKDTLQRGSELAVDYEYFAKSHDSIFEISVKLAHVLWRKVLPEQRHDADINLNKIGYELLVGKKYKLSHKVFDFAVNTLKKYSSEEMRLTFIINLAQSLKWGGDDRGSLKLINAQDWSATMESFKLCQNVLLSNFAEAKVLMLKIGAEGSISKRDYCTWPIFQEFRVSTEFQSTFESLFGLHEATKNNDSNTDDQITIELSAVLGLNDVLNVLAGFYTGAIPSNELTTHLDEINKRLVKTHEKQRETSVDTEDKIIS